MQQRYVNYLSKVDSSTELVLRRYQELVSLASTTPPTPIEGQEDQPQHGMNINSIANSTLLLESHASGIIRAFEELLVITKALKERWILNRLPHHVNELKEHYSEEHITEYEQQNHVLEEMINTLVDRISYVDYVE